MVCIFFMQTNLPACCFEGKPMIMETNEEQQLDADNNLILSSSEDTVKPEIPKNEEVNDGYNSADDTGNTNEDLDLEPSDDPDTNVDEYDLEALNGLDIDDEDGDLA